MTRPPPARSRLLVGAGVAGVLALVLAQQLLHIGGTDLFAQTLNDAIHVPMFVVLTVIVGQVRALPVAAVAAAALALGVATEALQYFTPRDASFGDLVYDAVGVVVGAGGVAGARRFQRRPPLARAWWAATAAVTIAVTAAAPVNILLAERARAEAFPVLMDPATFGLTPFVVSEGLLRLMPAPAAWPAHAGRPVLEVTWPQEPWPAVTLREVVPSWDGFDALLVDIYVPDGRPVTLTVAVHFASRPPRATAAWRTLPPGPHRVRYELSELLHGEQAPIARVRIHVGPDDAGRLMYLGSVRLVEVP